ncbi:unnamed protein product [Closterium sp. Naga37s-1]|nr:unnamed protein product [Closterium sp. Naga37s-1]
MPRQLALYACERCRDRFRSRTTLFTHKRWKEACIIRASRFIRSTPGHGATAGGAGDEADPAQLTDDEMPELNSDDEVDLHDGATAQGRQDEEFGDKDEETDEEELASSDEEGDAAVLLDGIESAPEGTFRPEENFDTLMEVFRNLAAEDPFGVDRFFLPLLFSYVADYPETCKVSCMQQLGSAMPCSLCYVGRGDLRDMDREPAKHRMVEQQKDLTLASSQLAPFALEGEGEIVSRLVLVTMLQRHESGVPSQRAPLTLARRSLTARPDHESNAASVFEEIDMAVGGLLYFYDTVMRNAGLRPFPAWVCA